MPAISISFNRFLLILLLQISVIPAAWSQLPEFDRGQMEWLGDRVFSNECNRNFGCLAAWNEGEDFPSLGIGHFIWYQAGQQERFEETFPSLLNFYTQLGYGLPDWIEQLASPDAPWQNRQQFLNDRESQRMEELRQFLATTTEVQVMFIVDRLHKSTGTLFSALDPQQRQSARQAFYQIAHAEVPFGMYALIDYVHFKGTGLAVNERYNDQGWGLLQVLLELQPAEATIPNFVNAAARVLERRVANAPADRNEQRWLAGWKNRLQTYLPSH